MMARALRQRRVDHWITGNTMQIALGLRTRLRFYLNRLRERLWVRPLMICVVSIIAVFAAGLADHSDYIASVPDISAESITLLLSIISDSMLVMAVLAVGAMLAAYEAASSKATPRSFAVVLADDVSQRALSTFIGAFIFSIIALLAMENGYYQKTGRFVLFALTVLVFALVILNFIRWVDRIARLGRMGTTIDKVEAAAASALRLRRRFPTQGAARATGCPGDVVAAQRVGYVQRIDIAHLQRIAEQHGCRITVASLPGSFAVGGRPLACVQPDPAQQSDKSGKSAKEGDVAAGGEEASAGQDAKRAQLHAAVRDAFVLGDSRTFDEDPRFGLIVLSEIASRALSPAVNDPGTAIDIIGTLVRLFDVWVSTETESDPAEPHYDRVAVPEILPGDMFDDAFNAIARDGAGLLEVTIRLQKAFQALAVMGDGELAETAAAHAAFALEHAQQRLPIPEEVARLQRAVHGGG